MNILYVTPAIPVPHAYRIIRWWHYACFEDSGELREERKQIGEYFLRRRVYWE